MPVAFRETIIRGSLEFPYKLYSSLIPEFFRNFPMHWHDEFEIIWVRDGHVWINIQSKVYLCSPEDIIIIPPKFIHSFRQYKDEPCRYYNAVFSLEILEPNSDSIISKKYFNFLFDNPLFKEIYFPLGHETHTALKPFVKILYDTRHSFNDSEMKIKSALYMYMDIICRLYTSDSNLFKPNYKIISRIKTVLNYVNQNYNKDLTVNEMAQLACLSNSHFMTTFKKITGQTFISYLNLVRLENSKKLISETELSILQISEECGFHNFSYFIRAFKKQYGKTPLCIRKKQ